MKAYLPKGTRVAVEDCNGNAIWYTTKKEIETDNSIDANCPITTLAAKLVETGGYKVYFLPSQERYTDDAIQSTLATIRPWMLSYDIPFRSTLPNPSATLRRVGIRINKSVWVLPEAKLDYTYINTLREGMSDTKLIPFDVRSGEHLLSVAISSFREQVREATAEAEEVQRRAERLLEEGEDALGNGRILVQQQYAKRAKDLIKRTEKLIKDLHNAADSFGIPHEYTRTGQLRLTTNTIFDIMAHRAKVYVESANELRNSGDSSAQAMANAMQSEQGGELTALVAADMMDEQGLNGERLRSAFLTRENIDNE